MVGERLTGDTDFALGAGVGTDFLVTAGDGDLEVCGLFVCRKENKPPPVLLVASSLLVVSLLPLSFADGEGFLDCCCFAAAAAT